MHNADWRLVRRGQTQFFGSKRTSAGDPFIFLPLFRTHREADQYCKQTGLWHQGIRPMQSVLSTPGGRPDENRSAAVFGHAATDGVRVVGVFVGFGSDQESCWEYFRASCVKPDGSANVGQFELLPEDEQPLS